MATLLSKNIGKFNTSISSRKPLFPGDLINNDAMYSPRPDYESPYFRKLSMNAELFCSAGSIADKQYNNAFKPEAVTSGYYAYKAALQYPEKIKQNTASRFGEEFLTIQRLSDSVPKEVVEAEVLKRNLFASQQSAETIAHNFPDCALNLPSDREGFLRSIHDIYPILQGAGYEDWVFEKHIWGPEVLLDMDVAIYDGDKSYSRNGALEQGVILAIQYGQPMALDARNGENIDVNDIHGRDISPVDQAWEDCKHIVDVVEKGFRTEASVALVLSRFMHDEWFETKTGPILHDKVHPSVKNRSKIDTRRMKKLKELMLPYMAEKCDWKTLHAVLDNDKDGQLKAYWDKNIAPLQKKKKPDPKILEKIFAYQPRGGFEHPEYSDLIKERRDKPKLSSSFNNANFVARMNGAHADVFDTKWRSKIFEDYDFERLGSTSNPENPADKNHITSDQAMAYIITNAMRKSRPPAKNAKTLLHIGTATSGIEAAHFIHENGISDISELQTIYDPMTHGDKVYAEDIAGDATEDYNDRTLEILRDEKWCQSRKVGRVIPLGVFSEIAKEASGRRESLNAERREAISADGPRKMSSASALTCMKRFVDHQATGIVIPPGPLLDAAQYQLIMRAVLVATGQVERPYEGGKYDMEFFYDDNIVDKKGNKLPPRKIDFGDLIILMGQTIEHLLNQPRPYDLRWHFVTMARMLDIYEKLTDPARCNVKTCMDVESGKVSKSEIISLRNIRPGFADFLFNDPGKAKQVRDIWHRLNRKEYPHLTPAVRGLLKIRAIHTFDDFDLADLPAEYKQAKDWHSNLSAQHKQNLFNKNALLVDGPAIAKP
ncbi:MAG: hypothetical protein MRY79_07995 [Alphaproteobacteria bacterium]|nr:hypothetical protein [Alphaproteobacteria bacterium]